MTITDELRVIIEAEVERAVRDMDRWDKQVGASEKHLKDIQHTLDAASRKVALFSTAMAGLGIGAIKVAADIEEQQKTFEVMLGSVEKGTALFAELQGFASATPLALGDINKSGADLLNYNVSASQVVGTLRMLGDASRGKAEALNTVVRAYGRMHLKGKASMEELNMLTEAGIPILTSLATQLGVSTDGLFDMVSAGQVGFPAIQAAFTAMTGEGGKFHDMMRAASETAKGLASTALDNLKMAWAELGKVALPLIKDILVQVADWARSVAELDEGTKRLILTLIGIGAAVSPMLKTASAGLSLAAALTKMSVASLSPALLGLAALIGAAAALAIAFAEARAEAEETFKKLIEVSRQSRTAALENAKAFTDIKAALPGMTAGMYEAAKATGNFGAALDELSKAEALRSRIKLLEGEAKTLSETYRLEIGEALEILKAPLNAGASGWWEGYQTDAERFAAANAALKASVGNVNGVLLINQAYWKALQSGSTEALIQVLEGVSMASPEIERLRKELQAIEGGSTIRALSGAGAPPPVGEAKKTWQAWWKEITDLTVPAGEAAGRRAAEAYLGGLTNSLAADREIARLLGESVDPLPYLEAQAAEIKKSLKALYAIDPATIDSPFQFGDDGGQMDASVAALVARYQTLAAAIEAAKEAQEALNREQHNSERAKALLESILTPSDRYLAQLKEIQELEGKGLLAFSEGAELRAAAWAGYAAAIGETGAELTKVKKEIESFSELVSRTATDSWAKWLGITKEEAAALGELSSRLADMGIESLVAGFESLGAALQDGKLSAEEFGDILAEQARAILKQLPMLFVQAGLQLIVQGNTGLGLGFLFGGLASAVISGLTESAVAAEENALGGVYSQGRKLAAFASGAAFTNQIIRAPTLFPLALMGEKKKEAIMPLTQMPGGELGVRASGGGEAAPVYFTVHNYAGAQVETRETSGPNGERQIEAIIRKTVAGGLARGEYDGVMGGRYGARPQGVRG